MKILISAGGTGGHLYPAISLAEKLKERNISVVFITQKKNYNSIKEKGFECEVIDIKNRIFSLLTNFFNSFLILLKYRPDLVIGMGSYISIPILLSAFFLRIPVLIHEQNVLPGRANRFLSYFSRKILISFKDTEKFFHFKKKIYLLGNPLRKTGNLKKEDIYKEIGLDIQKKTILVFGGSLGAKKINESILKAISLLDNRDDIQILHITGRDKFEDVKREKEKIKDLKIIYRILPYYENLLDVLKFVDLVISRAGATTCSEIAFSGKPAIFIPYPYATDNHQYYNAEIFEKNKGAIIIKDSELSADKLADIILKLLENEEELKEMGKRNRKLYIPFKEEEFIDLIYSLKKSKIFKKEEKL